MARKQEPASEIPPESKVSDEEDYNEDEDDDYDPTKKNQEEEKESDESEGEEPDYSSINTGVSQVRTRTQIYQENLSGGQKRDARTSNGLVPDESSRALDVNAIFNSLKSGEDDEWRDMVSSVEPETKKPEPEKPLSLSTEKIRIETSYTFAGKLVRETKLVDADSAEAKAYLNSTSGIMSGSDKGPRRSYVTVVRKIQGTEEQVPLLIKLKRPSLIDKFLMGDKKHKLTTLEKSRLDWASFVDKKSIKDDLALHNKAGYLDKQDFLGRMDAKRDEQYRKAKELERQRQWQMEQRSG
ncbi:putative SWR1-complex protein [Clavispora lusitaniae]|uniref:SWR1-complex protein 5 n=1 Tax=Clavispora lusitaniae TaxID=36911 RepID=A0AA91PWX8_CLALS|nr:putative SWR1-complex protein [Clavispora lusitaniae]